MSNEESMRSVVESAIRNFFHENETVLTLSDVFDLAEAVTEAVEAHTANLAASEEQALPEYYDDTLDDHEDRLTDLEGRLEHLESELSSQRRPKKVLKVRRAKSVQEVPQEILDDQEAYSETPSGHVDEDDVMRTAHEFISAGLEKVQQNEQSAAQEWGWEEIDPESPADPSDGFSYEAVNEAVNEEPVESGSETVS